MQDRIDRANQEIGALCAGQKFTMSLPVQPTDSDSILSSVTQDAQELLDERDHLYARADHATAELLALGRELQQARGERDRALAEAAVLRYAVERIEDKTALAASRQERVDAGIVWALAHNVLLVDSPIATQAAAVLAAIADWDQKPDMNPYGEGQGKLSDMWEKAQAYRAVLKE